MVTSMMEILCVLSINPQTSANEIPTSDADKIFAKNFQISENCVLCCRYKNWNKCPIGYALSGLYRTSGRYAGVTAIAKANCCLLQA